MKKSVISFLFICTVVILFTGFGEEQTDLSANPSSDEALSGLVFIPDSWNYGGINCGSSSTYGFELKNNGSTTASGQVFVYGGPPFSCTSGCSFNLSPHQSQIVTIKFAPYYEGAANTTIYAIDTNASASGNGVEPSEDPKNPVCQEP